MKIFFSLFFFSIASFIISLILLLVQGIINYIFFSFNNKKIIAERTLFEQFSYEVYSSISKPLPNYYNPSTGSEEPEKAVKINLNVNSYFDCRDLFSESLKPSCRNKIVNNYTNCNQDNSNQYYEFNINDFRNDAREICPYFSKYSQKIIGISPYIYQSNLYQMTYEELLKISEDNAHNSECQNGFYKSGILDTLGNILCLPFNLEYNDIGISISSTSLQFIPKNTDYHISVNMVISENRPLNHEWDLLVKEVYEKNVKEEDIYKRRNVSKVDFGLFDSYYDNTYFSNENSFKLSLIKDNILGYSTRKYNDEQELKLYKRSYIGFKNIKELKKFKKLFNENDHRDNPLYKLSSSGHNPLIEIIFSCVFLVIIFAYILIVKLEKFTNKADLLFNIFMIITILFLFVGLFIIVFHFIKYSPIYIDMDDRMEKVLSLYNKRIIFSQIFRIISLAFNFTSIVFICLKKKKGANYDPIINN